MLAMVNEIVQNVYKVKWVGKNLSAICIYI